MTQCPYWRTGGGFATVRYGTDTNAQRETATARIHCQLEAGHEGDHQPQPKQGTAAWSADVQ